MKRRNISSASPYEKTVGFSRAVVVGNQVFISGTAPIADDGSVAHVGDAYRQASRCLEIIKKAIEEAGGTIDDIVRTRMFVTDIAIAGDVTRAHAEYFAQIRPASTLVVIDKLIDPDMMVEIEADGVIQEK